MASTSLDLGLVVSDRYVLDEAPPPGSATARVRAGRARGLGRRDHPRRPGRWLPHLPAVGRRPARCRRRRSGRASGSRCGSPASSGPRPGSSTSARCRRPRSGSCWVGRCAPPTIASDRAAQHEPLEAPEAPEASDATKRPSQLPTPDVEADAAIATTLIVERSDAAGRRARPRRARAAVSAAQVMTLRGATSRAAGRGRHRSARPVVRHRGGPRPGGRRAARRDGPRARRDTRARPT